MADALSRKAAMNIGDQAMVSLGVAKDLRQLVVWGFAFLTPQRKGLLYKMQQHLHW